MATGVSHLVRQGTPREVQILQSASLVLINEAVHPQVLATGPRFLHRRRMGNVLDLGAEALLRNYLQRLGIGNTLEVERPDECGEGRKPALKRRRRFGQNVLAHGLEAMSNTAAIRVADDKK